ncbi:hypothetical protein NUU61_008993 [Penicillium alfredii]|uniref:Antifungal protein n=1 Tax=Penicillium alfredii TaxID=1506179 RepID=A0A9W9EMH1_9EURO|nr:uncharacterized protein NUU61_008993 [Penicillium alfredii]KAJ5084414.1 hypothetical protein NUU61_008993 [Penicillium alfredii]
MRFIPALLALAIPLAITASPIPEEEAPRLPGASPADPGALFERATQLCKIISSDGDVKCRAKPSFSGAVKHSFPNNSVWYFKCYKSSDCYNGNCTWDYNADYDCYVNGYYTSDNCSVSKLDTSINS